MRRLIAIFITLSILSGCGERQFAYFKFAPGVTHDEARQIIFPHTRIDERQGYIHFDDSASDWGGSVPVHMLDDGEDWLNPITREVGPMPDTWTAETMEIKADWQTIAGLDASPLVYHDQRFMWFYPIGMWLHVIEEALNCKRDPNCQLITHFVPDYAGEYMLDLLFSDKIKAENFGFVLFK